jgi:hypothetical protein
LRLADESVSGNAMAARRLTNCVFDSAGRIASRKGFATYNDSGPAGQPIQQVFMYDYASGNIPIASAYTGTAHKLYQYTTTTTTYDTRTDVTGTLTPTGSNWKFQNFNGKLIGAQAGNTMISKTGSGNFANISAASGTVPSGNEVLSAFGRLWAVASNKTSINWCALLDETHWSTGAGSINMLGTESAVRTGYDEIVALAALEHVLVVFMQNTIVLLSSPEDPASLGIFKIIEGVGCIARDSVQNIGNDLLFMDKSGLKSLSRAIEGENFPMADVSAAVRHHLVDEVAANPTAVRSAFYPEAGLYVLLAVSGYAWCFDLHALDESGIARVTQWNVPTWHSLYYHEGTMYIGEVGQFGRYSGYTDDGASYAMEYDSIWVDFDSPLYKILKKYNIVMFGAGGQQITLRWTFDYGAMASSQTISIPDASSLSEWGLAEWGLDEWGGGINLNRIRANGSRFGEVLSFGFSVPVSGAPVAIEQIALYVTQGREAR